MIKNSILTIAVLSLGVSALAEDWTNWRGPNYNGATSGTEVAGQGGAGSGNNQLDGPTSLALDATGALVIADTDNHRVMKYESGATSGSVVAGGNGQGSDLNQLDSPARSGRKTAGSRVKRRHCLMRQSMREPAT